MREFNLKLFLSSNPNNTLWQSFRFLINLTAHVEKTRISQLSFEILVHEGTLNFSEFLTHKKK